MGIQQSTPVADSPVIFPYSLHPEWKAYNKSAPGFVNSCLGCLGGNVCTFASEMKAKHHAKKEGLAEKRMNSMYRVMKETITRSNNQWDTENSALTQAQIENIFQVIWDNIPRDNNNNIKTTQVVAISKSKEALGLQQYLGLGLMPFLDTNALISIPYICLPMTRYNIFVGPININVESTDNFPYDITICESAIFKVVKDSAEPIVLGTNVKPINGVDKMFGLGHSSIFFNREGYTRQFVSFPPACKEVKPLDSMIRGDIIAKLLGQKDMCVVRRLRLIVTVGPVHCDKSWSGRLADSEVFDVLLLGYAEQDMCKVHPLLLPIAATYQGHPWTQPGTMNRLISKISVSESTVVNNGLTFNITLKKYNHEISRIHGIDIASAPARVNSKRKAAK
jgi:hypothetical protein